MELILKEWVLVSLHLLIIVLETDGLDLIEKNDDNDSTKKRKIRKRREKKKKRWKKKKWKKKKNNNKIG